VNKLISIIIPTLNARNEIEGALDSLSKWKNIIGEVIIVDGGSSDDTQNFVRKYVSTFEVKLAECDIRGIYPAMNVGLLMAKFEYVYFMGADDRVLLEQNTLYKRLIKGAVISLFNVVTIPAGMIASTHNFGISTLGLLMSSGWCHQGIIIKKDSHPQFDTTYKIISDNVMLIGLIDQLDKKGVVQFKDVLASYNMTGVSSVNRQARRDEWARYLREKKGICARIRLLLLTITSWAG
jgi:glycosyltransferase involved in cell wall biosynthesis